MTLEAELLDAVSQVHLSDYTTYDKCFVHKIACDRSLQRNGIARIFILDDKTSQITILMQQFIGSSKYPVYHRVEIIAAPMPTLMINSILLSPDSVLLALITRVSVYVLDVNPRFLPEEPSQESVIRPIYCAFDTCDIACSSANLPELLQVKWHPRQHNLLVVLTSNSTVLFVLCSRQQSSSVGVLVCKIRFLLDVDAFYHQLDWKNGSVVQNVGDDCELLDDTVRSDRSGLHGRLNLENALGFTCVDFDFGSPLLLNSEQLLSESQKSPDFSLYLLCETGDVILVSGCFGGGASVASKQVKFQVLHILPSTADNYGDEFCSLRCISPSTASCLPTVSTSDIMPPDVLVMANRSGHLLHGVVLHSVGDREKLREGASLCLIELVDLHLGLGGSGDSPDLVIEAAFPLAHPYQSWLTSGAPLCGQATKAPSGTDLLEATSAASAAAVAVAAVTGYGQQSQHYYVAHAAGLHLVRLSWLAQLSAVCRRLTHWESQAECTDLPIGHSTVRHLVCSQLPVASVEEAETVALNDGDFRVCGLIETTASSLESDPVRCLRSGTALLIVRAPLEPMAPVKSETRPSDMNPLVLSMYLEGPATDNAMVSTIVGPSSGNSKLLSNNLDNRPSEFAVQLHRQLGGESARLPMLSSSFSTLPDRVTDQQLIQLFVEMIKMLREGPLKRLVAARGFVEQYYSRLDDLLAVQSKKAKELGAYRSDLQTEALKLAGQHSVLLERQEMLEKRLADLANRLASLTAAPSKAEVAMEDEVSRWKARLENSLRKWVASLKDRCALVADRSRPSARRIGGGSPSLSGKPATESIASSEQWTNVSVLIKRETAEIKSLIKDVKRLNVLCEKVV